MRALDFHQCRLAVVDLLDNREEALRLLQTGPTHIEQLRALRAELDRLRAGNGDGDRVNTLVQDHIQATAALAAALQWHQRNPMSEPADREAAARLYASIVANRTGPGHAAKRRAVYADQIQDIRAALADDLARFPAVPGQPSVTDLLDTWTDIGLAIGRAISHRTAQRGTASERRVAQDINAVIRRIDRAIRLETEMSPALPRELASLVLGYVKTLAPASRRRVPKPVVVEKPLAADKPCVEPADSPPVSDERVG